jgi:heme exporter protein A
VQNLDFYRRLWRSSVAIWPLLEELQLATCASLPVRALSAGQRRRIGLALLQIRQAPLWVLDEPGTNLDREARTLMSRWVGAHLAGGGAAVVATHVPHELPGVSGSLLIEL